MLKNYACTLRSLHNAGRRNRSSNQRESGRDLCRAETFLCIDDYWETFDGYLALRITWERRHFERNERQFNFASGDRCNISEDLDSACSLGKGEDLIEAAGLEIGLEVGEVPSLRCNLLEGLLGNVPALI